MNEFKLNVYTDGSYSKNKPEVYGWGIAIYKNNELIKILNGVGDQFIESWQIGGECEAVIQVMQHVLNNIDYYNISILNINYDYLGIEKWAEGQWKAKKKVSQDYVQQFTDLKLQLMNKNIQVHFNKVKGHSGVNGNEIADKQAKIAVNNYYQ